MGEAEVQFSAMFAASYPPPPPSGTMWRKQSIFLVEFSENNHLKKKRAATFPHLFYRLADKNVILLTFSC